MALILIVLLVSYFNKVKYGKLWGLMGQNVVSLQKSTHFIPMLASPSEPWAPICLDSGSFSEIYNCFQTGYHNLSEAFPIQVTLLLWWAQWTHPWTVSLETQSNKWVPRDYQTLRPHVMVWGPAGAYAEKHQRKKGSLHLLLTILTH